jgi:hypothetical protein
MKRRRGDPTDDIQAVHNIGEARATSGESKAENRNDNEVERKRNSDSGSGRGLSHCTRGLEIGRGNY